MSKGKPATFNAEHFQWIQAYIAEALLPPDAETPTQSSDVDEAATPSGATVQRAKRRSVGHAPASLTREQQENPRLDEPAAVSSTKYQPSGKRLKQSEHMRAKDSGKTTHSKHRKSDSSASAHSASQSGSPRVLRKRKDGERTGASSIISSPEKSTTRSAKKSTTVGSAPDLSDLLRVAQRNNFT
jgi:hypothetical protein